MIKLAATLATAALLAGCASNPSGTVATITLPTISLPALSPSATATIQSIQAAAVKGCGFEPAAATVLAIIAQFAGAAPVATIVGNVAGAVCDAISKATFASANGKAVGALPMVRGVVLKGRFK